MLIIVNRNNLLWFMLRYTIIQIELETCYDE